MRPEPTLKLLMLALAAFWGTRPPQAVAQPPGANVRVLEHISYGSKAPQAQMLNAYLVQRDTPAAVIVQILSGGWNSAPPQKTNVEPFKPYSDAGISVIVVAHRPVGADIHWPTPGDDIARAIQFVRAHAGEWGIDPNRPSGFCSDGRPTLRLRPRRALSFSRRSQGNRNQKEGKTFRNRNRCCWES